MIIPALNEANFIGEAILAAQLAGAAEVIVVDGGSTDETDTAASRHRARVIHTESIRALQINRGIETAAHENIVVVHADTLLPIGAAAAIEEALDGGAIFGGFHLRFREGGARLAYVAFMINARTRLTKKPWGDQAQFGRRATLRYREFPIMEDYELARRMKRAGRVAILPLVVATSGRRFLSKGVIRTSLVNWLIIVAYHLGVPPVRLARWYRQ